MSDPAVLVLEDGSVFEGRAFGARAERFGEVVFNTSMTGYQEVLTDPSYCGQIVTMTYPHIGNYGISPEDMESGKAQVAGFVVKELSPVVSNFRSREDLSSFLKRHGIPGIEGIDTRALTRKLRVDGAMRGVLSSTETGVKKLLERVKRAPKLEEQDLVQQVSCGKEYAWSDGAPSAFYHGFAPKKGSARRVVAIDYGMKHNILRDLAHTGCDVTVLPASATAEQVMALKPEGVFLSNGPGDPQKAAYAVKCVKGILGKVPVFGICLGHQILGIAYGAKTFKLKFGHRGANHPVKRLATGHVEVTTQNHGFAVSPDGLEKKGVEVTHVSLNDGTVEGMRHTKFPAFSVQYHPEASAGPHDSKYLFLEFHEMMDRFHGKSKRKSASRGKA